MFHLIRGGDRKAKQKVTQSRWSDHPPSLAHDMWLEIHEVDYLAQIKTERYVLEPQLL